MSKVRLARVSEIPPGAMIMREHATSRSCCQRERNIYAMDDVCTHEGAPLHEGQLGLEAPNLLTCPWHDAHFDVCTGRVHQDTPWATDTQTYGVEIVDGEVFVEV